MKDKISVQEIDYLSLQLDKLTKKYADSMTLEEIKLELDNKIIPDVEAQVKKIFRETFCISDNFSYSIHYNTDDKFDIEITFSSADVY